jgi:predicted PurR-regulated permease PerM
MIGTGNQAAAGWSIRNSILLVAGITAACLVVWQLNQELLLTFLAVLFAVSLRGAAEWIAERSPLSPRWAMAVIMLLVVLAVIGFWWWVGPQLLQQAYDLGKALTQEYKDLTARYGHTEWGHALLQKLNTAGTEAAQTLAAPMLTAASSTLGAVAGFFVLVVTMLYFASSPELYVKGLVHLVPQSRRARTREVFGKVAAALRWWFLGQLIGMPMALALGVIAGVLTFVPYFGAILAAIPALAIALGQGMHMAFLTIVVFSIGHFVEGYIMSPLVQDRMVRLPPALLILSMTFLGSLLGPMGIILATPLAAAGLVLISEFYVVDVLKDESGRDVTRR